jgi:hypothetical protein
MLRNFFEARTVANAAVELQIREDLIRRKLIELLVETIVPHLLRESSRDATLPDGYISSKAKDSIHNKMTIGVPTMPHLTFYVRNRLHIITNITCSKPLNAMQAFHSQRPGFAASVANNIINALKHQFLKVNDQRRSTDVQVSEDKVIDVQHRIERSSAEEN